jgi:predicted nucleic acid-binding protein
MLIDTDIIIWYMRGNPNALNALEQHKGFRISVVTYMEEEISSKAMCYVEQHYLGHSVQLADALIGATAVSHGISLLTGNDKHYRIVKEIKLSKFRP